MQRAFGLAFGRACLTFSSSSSRESSGFRRFRLEKLSTFESTAELRLEYWKKRKIKKSKTRHHLKAISVCELLS
jgi:hypothetical protein